MIKRALYNMIDRLISFYERERTRKIIVAYQLQDVSLGRGQIEGNIHIGQHTYINNNFRIVSGDNSQIEIGSNCAIGRSFSCFARTHSFNRPTPLNENVRHNQVEQSIKIGNHVWIGDHVVIKPGINISEYAVIGANSVVTCDVKPFEIVGGVPARHIRFNTDHEEYSK